MGQVYLFEAYFIPFITQFEITNSIIVGISEPFVVKFIVQRTATFTDRPTNRKNN